MSGPDLPQALIDAELARIATSHAFRRAPLQLRLLRYLIERARAGDAHRLKAGVIAMALMGSTTAHAEGGDETWARVSMRRLRQRLARYYADEGAWATVEIEVPVGSYAPRVHPRSTAGAPRLPSIAVLPFRNFSGDPALDAFADALAEETTDALAQVPGLRIVARTSAFAFRDRTGDVRAIGAALGVATLLEGSVQGHDGRRRAVAQWVRVRDGFHAWSCTWESGPGESADDFRDRVAREIVLGLQRRMLEEGAIAGRRPTRPLMRRSRVPLAQERYHAARYLMRTNSGDGYRRAVAPLREAIAADPEFALAHCALACALLNLVGLTLEPADALVDEARAELARTLDLDPELGEAHAASGFVRFAFDHDWGGAEPCHLRGIRCAPSLCYAHSTYAWGLMLNGRFVEADAEYRFARELDPLDLKVRAHHALALLYAGQDDRAADELAAILELEPAHVIAQSLRATADLWRGDFASAGHRYAGLLRAHPGLTMGEVGLAQVEAETGRPRAARARLRRLLANGTGAHLPPYQIAMVHARLRDRDAALAWLERAAVERDMNFVCAAVDRSFAGLRDDAGFVALLRRHGLRAPVPA